MASGRKNYFRHSFFARNDNKLRSLKDEVGVGYYFYYFSLLELCGTECEHESKTEFAFHNSIMRELWNTNLTKVDRILNKMNTVCLLDFKKLEKSYHINIPNFPKYLGSYTNKKDPNLLIKEKKRKEKKRKPDKSDSDLKFKDDIEKILDYLNQNLGTKFQPGASKNKALIIARIKDGYKVEDFKVVIDKKIKSWRKNPDMAKHLNPGTLFGSKMEKYLNELSWGEKELEKDFDKLLEKAKGSKDER